jgi:hypothetical protein
MKKMVERILVNLGGDISLHGAEVSKPMVFCVLVFFSGWTVCFTTSASNTNNHLYLHNSSGTKAIRGQVLRFNHLVPQESTAHAQAYLSLPEVTEK